MTRYTVTYTRTALDALAGQWLDSDDRRAITLAGDEIDRQLGVDAPMKGELQHEGFRRLVVATRSPVHGRRRRPVSNHLVG